MLWGQDLDKDDLMKRLHKPRRSNWSGKLWNEYLAAREKLVDAIFNEAESKGLSNNQLAAEAKLAYQTVANLDNYTTIEPRETTIWKLARAVGFEIEIKRVKAIKLKIKKAS